MLHGRVVRPDGYVGTLVSLDDARATTMPGVQIVRDGGLRGRRRTERADSQTCGRRTARGMARASGSAHFGLHLRPSAESTASSRERRARRFCAVHGRRRRRRSREGDEDVRRHLPDSLHRARSSRAARSGCGVDRRQAHGLVRDPASVRRALGTRIRVSRARGARARHRARYGFRIRRQALAASTRSKPRGSPKRRASR